MVSRRSGRSPGRLLPKLPNQLVREYGAGVVEAVGANVTGIKAGDHGLDTTGVADVVATALRPLEPRGILVVVGHGARHAAIEGVDLLLNGKTIRGRATRSSPYWCGECRPDRR
jgi:Zn-dependent alcohol dehydrogenase